MAQEIAARLRKLMGDNGWSVAEVSRRSGVSRMTVTQVLDGVVWCDLLTIADLEKSLDVDLWPGREPGNPPR
ncbi:helix-turn-helix domain-containing protein [Streptomyces sp. NPDC002788]